MRAAVETLRLNFFDDGWLHRCCRRHRRRLGNGWKPARGAGRGDTRERRFAVGVGAARLAGFSKNGHGAEQREEWGSEHGRASCRCLADPSDWKHVRPKDQIHRRRPVTVLRAPFYGLRMARETLDPTACLKCKKPVTGRGAVTCSGCGATFLLLHGKALDASLTPPLPLPTWEEPSVRSSGAFVRHLAVVRRLGLAFGPLDPIVASVMMESPEGPLKYHDISSIAAMRVIGVGQVVLAVLLTIPFLIVPGFALFATLHPAGFVAGALLIALHLHRTFILKALRLRVVGVTGRVCDLTLHGQGKKRRQVFELLQERCGLSPPQPIP